MVGIKHPDGVPERVQLTCVGCGGTFSVPPSRLRKSRVKYCTQECRASQSAQISRDCVRCGTAFSVYQSELSKPGGRGLFCSRSCYFDRPRKQFTCEACGKLYWLTEAAIAAKEREGITPRCCSRKCWISIKRLSNTRICCARCGKSVSVKGHRASQQFCSKQCSGLAGSEEWKAKRISTSCEVCGKAIEYTHYTYSNRERHFCSRECMSKHVGDWAISTGFKDGVRADIGFYVRSSWEANIIRFFRYMKWPHEYERKRFRLSTSWYTPDFYVNGFWVEVKGYMRADAARKIDEFRSLYPDETLVVLDESLYDAIEKEFSGRVLNWEAAYVKRGRRKRSATC